MKDVPHQTRKLKPEIPRHEFNKSCFFKEVYHIVKQIPRGKVLTYGQIAILMGVPHMARQVGWAMHGCPTGLPWQRVVGAGGKILINSLSSGEGPLLQRKLLELDGIHFTGKCVDMKIHQFRPREKNQVERRNIKLHGRFGL